VELVVEIVEVFLSLPGFDGLGESRNVTCFGFLDVVDVVFNIEPLVPRELSVLLRVLLQCGLCVESLEHSDGCACCHLVKVDPI